MGIPEPGPLSPITRANRDGVIRRVNYIKEARQPMTKDELLSLLASAALTADSYPTEFEYTVGVVIDGNHYLWNGMAFDNLGKPQVMA
jgi:hypothetical protein